ncbi:MAG: MoaD/ThiS family protein [archaeon GBS-70-058]|nr:MoaD/ThiS family protein [Candidatus Culexarchaeum nevadense]
MKVKFISYLRDLIGRSDAIIKMKDGASVNDLMEILWEKWPIIGKMDLHGEGPIIILLNGKPVGRSVKLNDGDEVELIPPATGG